MGHFQADWMNAIEPAAVARPGCEASSHPERDVYASAVSTWEIAIKAGLGKITADLPAIVRAARNEQFEELPVTIRHTARLLSLPTIHRDPFDRLLVAQALEHDLAPVTHDLAIQRYPATIVWD